MDGAAHRRIGAAVGGKDDAVVVDSCCREIDKGKQAVDLKVTGEVSSSGRMAGVGRHVAECGVRLESNSCL